MSHDALLTLNAGSSSVKLGLFHIDGTRALRMGGAQLDLGRTPATLVLRAPDGVTRTTIAATPDADLHAVTDEMLGILAAHFSLGELACAGHRVVHGGPLHTRPALLDDATLAELQALTPLAPLHQPASLRLVRALRSLRPGLPQTASFDTAFHATQDDLTRRFALPRALHEAGVRRYGFHGLSYAHIARELARREPRHAAGRVVAAHLGSGASLCAMRAGRGVDTSMGFSALDGLPMSTRCGTLDAGVVLYLASERGMTPQAIEDLLYHRSGLLGVSGISGDARVLRASDEPAAREALALFALRAAGETARLAASLGGLDALVFTAGIGEHDAATRADICARLAWLGVTLDAAANARHAPRIDAPDSRVGVHVIPADEEQVIADEALTVLKSRP